MPPLNIVYTNYRINSTYLLKKRECSIEIKIPKEVRDYHENIFFGLNTRQFICSVLAVGIAVGIYFALQPYVGTEEIGWMCILGAAPFAACGFFTYHGMTAEQVLWAWVKSEFSARNASCSSPTPIITPHCSPPSVRA